MQSGRPAPVRRYPAGLAGDCPQACARRWKLPRRDTLPGNVRISSSRSIRIRKRMPPGHTLTHSPQPVHFSRSTSKSIVSIPQSPFCLSLLYAAFLSRTSTHFYVPRSPFGNLPHVFIGTLHRKRRPVSTRKQTAVFLFDFARSIWYPHNRFPKGGGLMSSIR